MIVVGKNGNGLNNPFPFSFYSSAPVATTVIGM